MPSEIEKEYTAALRGLLRTLTGAQYFASKAADPAVADRQRARAFADVCRAVDRVAAATAASKDLPARESTKAVLRDVVELLVLLDPRNR